MFLSSGGGCLHRNRFISSARLQQEALSEQERAAHRYVDDVDVEETSVITLHAIGTAHAAHDLLLMVTKFFVQEIHLDPMHNDARTRQLLPHANPACDPACRDCENDHTRRLARGDRARLPGRGFDTTYG